MFLLTQLLPHTTSHKVPRSVSMWMVKYKLTFNTAKPAFLIIGSKIQQDKFSTLWPILLLDHEMSPSTSARNVGVMFDCDLKFRQHLSKICRSCFYHIRDLRRIRRHLSRDTAKTIAVALIGSTLDYCNSLL